METVQFFLACAMIILVFQCLLFLIALVKKDNSIADTGWGIGFILIAVFCALYFSFVFSISNMMGGKVPDPAFIMLISLVVIWGLRLSIYIFIRNWGKPEDWRYAKWREDWGDFFYIRSFLQVFLLQGVFMIMIGSPVIFAAKETIVDFTSYGAVQDGVLSVGILIWLTGFYFQAVGDYQLYRFKNEIANKGKVMRYGVWRYTRHPNYFGESSMWWGIFLISCVSAHSIYGMLLRMIGPVTITFMLLRVSGVTMLENKYKGNKEYEDYQKNTSSFLPLPQKNGWKSQVP
jgi:steroid 5-alpha reductase family enzyme